MTPMSMRADPEDPIVAFARDLVAIPTENPPGNAYDECVGRIATELDALSYTYEIVETGDNETQRRAIVAQVGESGPLLYLHGHYDVVPAFARRQFEPRLDDERLIGRGSSDMKGGLAAIVYAARDAAAAGARVGLVIVPDEETGGRLGAERLAELGPARHHCGRRHRRRTHLGDGLARLPRCLHAARHRARQSRARRAAPRRHQRVRRRSRCRYCAPRTRA